MDMEARAPIHPEISNLPRELLCTLPKMGSMVEIFIDKVFEGIYLLKGGGQWVKFYNIIFNIQSGGWRGVVQNSCKVRIISFENSDVLHRKRIYEDRLASYVECLPLSSFSNPSLTVTDPKLGGYSTLRASLTHPEVIHVFRSFVRVIASHPWRAGDLCSPNGHYRVRLTLEDPTARIHAYIFGEDGEKFFGGYPAHDVLTRKMNMLLGMGDGAGDSTTARIPRWISCCLKSYFIDANNPFGSRRYRIFGTAMIG